MNKKRSRPIDFTTEFLSNPEEEESLVRQEHVDRILKNAEDEIPLVAKELYPDDEKAQKTFIEFVEQFIDTLA
jgi:hypothetical protein